MVCDAQIKVTGITDGHLAQVAKDTEGFSGREIAKLVIAWQAAAYGTENAELNVELMKQVLKEQKESRRIKAVWESSAGSAQDDSSVGKASA
eukprot:scaffold90_cov264-Pinguiococcus_pyrenoidosus.AAC.24